MAHALDRLIFTALTVIFAFAVARNVTGNLILSMLIAAVAPYPAHLLLHLTQERFRRSSFSIHRKRRRLAAQTVRCWSVERDASCRTDILSLLRAAYPAVADALCFAEDATKDSIPLHLFLTLKPVGEDAVADVLCRLREESRARAVLAATAEFTPEARALTLLPSMPTVALIDGPMLAALLVKNSKVVRSRALPTIRAPKPMPSRARALRMLPAALFLLGMYLAFGLTLYLPAGLALIWCILMLLKRRPTPHALFP